MSVQNQKTIYAQHLIALLLVVAMEALCMVGSDFHQMRSGRNAAAKPHDATNNKLRGTSQSILGKVFHGKGRRLGSSARNKLMFEAEGKCKAIVVLFS
jgi:hypothetical protein